MDHKVIIIGGGLSGLFTAHLLHQHSIGFLLLEARQRLGGRILTVDGNRDWSDDGFDLGPSWVWPESRSAITPFLEDLKLQLFAQQTIGDMLFQQWDGKAAIRTTGYQTAPISMRPVGGVGRLVSALIDKLPNNTIQTGAEVVSLTQSNSKVLVGLKSGEFLSAHTVISTLPPRLLAKTVTFSPELDAVTKRNWIDTPTWMATHAKFIALYERPFWRDIGLSGEARSQLGPLVEVHDATTSSGKAALFGFLGISAKARERIGHESVVSACVEQLKDMFGEEAASPINTLYKDWSQDRFTATLMDSGVGGHPMPGRLASVPSVWAQYMLMAGSEAGRREPGYLAGAIEAAEYAALEILNRKEEAEFKL